MFFHRYKVSRVMYFQSASRGFSVRTSHELPPIITFQRGTIAAVGRKIGMSSTSVSHEIRRRECQKIMFASRKPMTRDSATATAKKRRVLPKPKRK